ncbi:hypothetical protein GIB67_026596 [Kingdonia uniflora]|uniref:Flavodoxin-like domain-containing protein n=1 Tax=Kingdonia uniflora TaxID=39325 RepID=A0A7J7NNU8_9MAGN|nr:hypothetical protein GIB67_026596 [Kingdonia uniflora]
MEDKPPRLLILYDSQTGNALDVAERVGREAERMGQGDVSDSMKVFWRFLFQRNLSQSWLEGVNYAVFGLGDSGYQKYNFAAKKLDKRLSDLGAKPIIGRGLGDDQHPSGYEGALDPWLSSLWNMLNKMEPTTFLLKNIDLAMKILDSPKFQIIYHIVEKMQSQLSATSDLKYVKMQIENATSISPQNLGHDRRKPHCLLQMIMNKQLTKVDCGRNVCHFELETLSSDIAYQVGDVLEILPSQNPVAVEALIQRCSLNIDSYITVEPKSVQTGIPDISVLRTPIKLRTFVELAMDITSASPRCYFFEVMSFFVTAENEKERLLYFSSLEGRDDLYQYNQKERRTVLEVLEDFPSVQMPFEWLVQLLPPLKTRPFSISSSLASHPNQVHLTISHAQNDGVLSEEKGGGFIVSFLRDQKQKVYVQHKMQDQSQRVLSLLSAGVVVYVAGSSTKMPTDVFSAKLSKISKGGSYNPLTLLSPIISESFSGFLFIVCIRIPAQVLGSITGVKLILQAFSEVGHGPRPNVDLHHGALTEGLFTIIIISISLGLAKNNPNRFFMKTWISSVSKLVLHILGSDLTGGCMNPAAVMGWAFARGEHISKEHLYVYWLAPIEATLLGVWTFKLLSPPAKKQEEEAKKNSPMDNAGTSNNNRGRTECTPPMDRYFLDLMLEQVRGGQRNEKLFTKIAWADMKKKMNEKYENMNDDKEVLKNRYKKLKNIYTILKALLDHSGFGWDDEKHLEHSEAKPMRTKTMPNYHDLDEICGNSTATGQYARSAKDLKSKKLSDVNITQVQDSSNDIAVEDDSPLVNNEVEKTKKKKKHKLPETTSTTKDIKKGKRCIGEGIIDALKSITSAVDGIKNRRSKSEKKLNVVEALDAISGLLEGDYLKACDLLEGEGKTRMFLNLAENKLKMWLMWKINPKKDN